MKLVVTSNRLGEMSGGFGETGEPHVEDDFLGYPSSLPDPNHHLLTDHAASPMVIVGQPMSAKVKLLHK